MSSNKYTYLGPFYKTQKQPPKIVPRPLNWCVKCKSQLKSSVKFCSECGTIANTAHTHDEENQSLDHITQALHERLRPHETKTENSDYWHPNVRWGQRREMILQEEIFDLVLSITPELIMQEKYLFEVAFAPELEILKTFLSKVETDWGVLQWYS